MHAKSNIYNLFCQFKAQIENLLSVKIKILQSGGGKEFMSKTFQSFLTQNEMTHRISCPHTPQQNGSVERKHCHIVETGLSLSSHSHMPKNSGMMPSILPYI